MKFDAKKLLIDRQKMTYDRNFVKVVANKNK